MGRKVVVRWRGKFANCNHVVVSLRNLEGDCRMDRVRRRRLLTPYQDGPHQKLFSSKNFNSSSKVANCLVDIIKYFN